MIDSRKITKQNISIQSAIAAIAVLLFGVKFTAYYLTGSLAIYTDTLESLVNILAGFFGL